jgi:hypothetical protein
MLISLRSIVVEHLQELSKEDGIAVAFIYCDYKDRENQTDLNLFSSLVKQLALQQKEMPSDIRDLYCRHHDGHGPLVLEEALHLLWRCANLFRKCFILVDALDEYLNEGIDDETHIPEISLIARLQKIQQGRKDENSFKLFITSRENHFIADQLQGCDQLDIRAMDSDIESYLRARAIDDTKFRFAKEVRNDPTICNQIVVELVRKAQGMYVATGIC